MILVAFWGKRGVVLRLYSGERVAVHHEPDNTGVAVWHVSAGGDDVDTVHVGVHLEVFDDVIDAEDQLDDLLAIGAVLQS